MNSPADLRRNEVIALLYRLFLAFFFYQVARFLFWIFNRDVIPVSGVSAYLSLAWHGIKFDTTGILYVNAVFILLSLLPLFINTGKNYQKFLFWLYFITNGMALAMNFGDFIYYRFAQSRLTSAALSVAGHEDNLGRIALVALLQHPMVLVTFVVTIFLWQFLYKKVRVVAQRPRMPLKYVLVSVFYLCLAAVLTVGGIRGDFKHSTRPINLVDANRFVTNPLHANIVLNSTFSFFRTLFTNNFKEVHFVDEKFIDENIKPYKYYPRAAPKQKPNVVIFILESFAKEYSGAFNKDNQIKNFVSYTPFVDSLAGQSLICTNAFANGRQSIHGMSSVLAGIPSLVDAFTSSPYSNQKIQSIVSVCNDMGYDTSFFHGAANGSMGFLGFGNILGFKHYYGKTEYNNDADYDGIWGIWDEPFFQYFAKTLDQKKTPFMATLFSLSSHHPFKVPAKYEGKFKEGPLEIDKPIQYTDYSLKKFFETAKKMPWYQNTVFVLVADHTNQIYYPEYQKEMNHFAVPIIFFSPNPEYHLKGEITEPAQQIDIYPTLVDLLSYNKPFRSWGRSVISGQKDPNIIVNSNSVFENFTIGNYIYRFDGKDVTQVFKKDDLGLDKNIITTEKNTETERGKQLSKAWYQDYMHRVIKRKLD